MADVVQQQLEDMVPELEDLRTRGLFSEAELRAIVSRRKGFEFALQRRRARLTDALRYLSFELRTNALRARRKARLGLKGTSVSDHSLTRRVHFIFTRALRKFPGDLRLWRQYIAYAKRTRSVRRLGRLFPSALRLHPRVVELWVEAASWELTDNGDMAAARTLLQRGLRINGDNPLLWREYLRLEALYALQVGEPAVVAVVARHAADKVPGHREPLVRVLLDCGAPERFEDALAALAGDDVLLRACVAERLEGVRAAVAGLEAALRADVDRHWQGAVAFLRRVAGGGAGGDVWAADRLLAALTLAASACGGSPELYWQRVDVLRLAGDEEAALSVARTATEQFPGDAALWGQRLSLSASSLDMPPPTVELWTRVCEEWLVSGAAQEGRPVPLPETAEGRIAVKEVVKRFEEAGVALWGL